MHPSRQPMQVRNSLTLDRGGSNPLKTGATAEGPLRNTNLGMIYVDKENAAKEHAAEVAQPRILARPQESPQSTRWRLQNLGRMPLANFSAVIDVPSDMGQQETYPLSVDPISGKVWTALRTQGMTSQTSVECSIFVTCEGCPTRFLVATCGAEGKNLRLTPEAEKMGWKVTGRELAPPVVMGIAGDIKVLEEGLNQRTMELKQYLESLTALTETVDGNSKQLEQMHTMQAGMNTTVQGVQEQLAGLQGGAEMTSAKLHATEARVEVLELAQKEESQQMELLEERTSAFLESICEVKAEIDESSETLRDSWLRTAADLDLLAREVAAIKTGAPNTTAGPVFAAPVVSGKDEIWQIAEHKAEIEGFHEKMNNMQAPIRCSNTRFEKENTALRSEVATLRQDMRDILLSRLDTDNTLARLDDENRTLREELAEMRKLALVNITKLSEA